MAQWAQLKAGPPTRGGLERGHWYRVETLTKNDVIRVLGPNAVGVTLDVPSVRLTDQEPTTITRVHSSTFQAIKPGQPAPMMEFYGVCPKGHRIEPLRLGDDEAQCPQCKRKYRVNDE